MRIFTIGEIHRQKLLTNRDGKPYSDKSAISKVVNSLPYQKIKTKWGKAKGLTIDQIDIHNILVKNEPMKVKELQFNQETEKYVCPICQAPALQEIKACDDNEIYNTGEWFCDECDTGFSENKYGDLLPYSIPK